MATSPITVIHATASLTQKPNNSYKFVGMKCPRLVVDFQELNGGRWNVTGTILWLFGWLGRWVLGFVSQLPLPKTAKNSCQQSNQYWTVLFLKVIWGLINHLLLLHHLFLSSLKQEFWLHISYLFPLDFGWQIAEWHHGLKGHEFE